MKRALLIGCTYTGSDLELHGTMNDVIRMRKVLIDKYGFNHSDIRMLIEYEGFEQPTGKNIMNAIVDTLIETLYMGCDEVYIHFSGHGTQVWDLDGDEADGLDECWVPIDHRTGGVITDDLLNKYFKYFPVSCKVTCVVDACHSGTCLDIKYKVDTNSGELKILNEECLCKNDNISLISGCRDSQTSLDVVKNGSWGGALTYAILNVIDNTETLPTLFEIVNKSRDYMSSNGYSQVPQLCTAKYTSSNELFIKK